MIMYTMMPNELIYPTAQEVFEKQQMIDYHGIPLLVAKNEQQEVEVIRILSSDPKHYLDLTIQPGSKIPSI